MNIEMEPTEPAAIIYTSGTTGFPKGAALSHGNVTSNMHSVKHCCGMRAEDRLLLYLPLFHCFGQNFILNAGLNACATIILQRRFYPAEVLKVTAAERIAAYKVPHLVRFVDSLPKNSTGKVLRRVLREAHS